MEPRPQRPRTQSAPQSPAQGGGAGQPGAGVRPGEYPEGVDPATFIAPSRTEYDYSPLDLAPSGQRRRRQFVAAAVGGLVVLLIASVAFFGYLVFRDDTPNNENDDVLAAQTQVAMQEATLTAQQTVVADAAAAEQTAQADGSGGDRTTPESDATETAASDETPATTEEGASDATETADAATTEAGGGEGPTSEELAALLPAKDAAPAGLDSVVDNELDFDGVVVALGSSRTAETNLESWGWSGNAARQFNPSDASTIEATGVSVLTVSIHGFATPEAAAEALPFFSDILANTGYEEAEAPKLGDNARMLTTTLEDGSSEVALYVQAGQMLYRVTGASLEGDPTKAVADIMSGMLAGVPQLNAVSPAERRT